MPGIIPNDKYVLSADSGATAPPPSKTYTASKTVRHRTKEGGHIIVTGSRTIIDDILSWSTAQSTLLLLFKFICIIFRKYCVSLKIKKFHLFNNRFECMGRDIMTLGNTTALSKYDLVCK